ncbi:hypothetical protein [Corynebacterium sp. c8Ua_99]|uniref:hypothetical protein n=1 Tax=Corynebacterium sp. c8Ua_99 TaxID=3032335 RepID=UPI00326314A2
MKLDKVAGSKNDEFYTPAYAITPLLPHLKPNSHVWCPFDEPESLYVQMLKAAGHKVTATHIRTGQDFFTTEPPAGVDCIVSNPPYSLKTDVLERLFTLGHPFAMLVGVVGLFESQRRFEMFRDNSFQMLYFNRRVAYLRDYGDEKPALNPPFSSAYVCHKVLPKPVVFEEIDKSNVRPLSD